MAAVSSPLLVGPEGGTAPGASEVGGKALNLWRLTNVLRCNVPSWFCVTSTAFQETIEVCPFIAISDCILTTVYVSVCVINVFCVFL